LSHNFLSADKLCIQNHLAVLPCGDIAEHKIMNWTIEDLKPYASYMLEGKGIDTMFGGLIFNTISSRENRYIYPLYASFGELADKTDWQLAIDNLFKRNANFHAAALTNRKLDIWVTIPYPLNLQSNFGTINMSSLNFEYDSDRLLALKWWVDTFIKRWEKEKQLYDTLKFRGFVWQKDSIADQDLTIVKGINQFIHEHNYLTMWLPNYGSSNVNDWEALGFNLVTINPNYYGNTNHDYRWINNAAAFGKFYHTGIQIYYGKGNIFNETHFTDYLNLGLPQYNDYMKDCLLVCQFPNQHLKDVYENRVVDYIRLYSFIKGIYSKVHYLNIPY